MMDPAVKTALAACVLLAGDCAATLLRNNPPAAASPGPAAEQLLIRGRAQAPTAAMRPRRERRAGCQPVPQDADRPPTVVTPSDRREPPPPLAQDYPRTDGPTSCAAKDGTGTSWLAPTRSSMATPCRRLPIAIWAPPHGRMKSSTPTATCFTIPNCCPSAWNLKSRRAVAGPEPAPPPSGPLVPVPHPP